MFIKSENQRYIVNYKYIDENNIYAKVFFIKDKNRIIEKNSIHAKSGAGGERIAISNDGKYLVTAFYEKRVFIYNINNEGNYKLIKTKKYIDDVEIIDNNIYVIYVNGVIDIYSLEGVLIETKRNVNLIPLDICGEQYLIEDTYIKLADKIIKPIKFSLFNNAIYINKKVILSEIYGIIVCYDSNGIKIWEYISEDKHMKIGKLFYSECVNSLIAEIYYSKKDNKNEKFIFFNLNNGEIIMEREIYNRDFVICNNNSVFIDSDYNIILLEDLIIKS